jgi:hypothetical protein
MDIWHTLSTRGQLCTCMCCKVVLLLQALTRTWSPVTALPHWGLDHFTVPEVSCRHSTVHPCVRLLHMSVWLCWLCVCGCRSCPLRDAGLCPQCAGPLHAYPAAAAAGHTRVSPGNIVSQHSTPSERWGYAPALVLYLMLAMLAAAAASRPPDACHNSQSPA